MINHYIYDGSFDGLLSSIYDAYYTKDKPDKIIDSEKREDNFLVREILIESNEENAKKVYHAIINKISNSALKKIYYAYLSEIDGIESDILEFVRLGFKIGADIESNLANPIVLKIENTYKKVSRERHRMTGLIRFKELKNNILYAEIEPDYNVIGVVAPHFTNRLASENFIIHDKKRKLAVFYNKKEWIIKEVNGDLNISFDKREEDYQSLWKMYFKSISIKEKITGNLQRSNMPKKYWKYLIEKGG